MPKILRDYLITCKEIFYRYFPTFAGSFPYFGVKVYFPKNSHLFRLACEQGVFEKDNVWLLSNLIKPNSVYFDIGANIGLLSIPLLQACPDCKVVSVEASPNSLKFLQRTAKESPFGDRWRIIDKAVGSQSGEIDFYIAAEGLGAFDGLKDTKRAGNTTKVTVPLTTIDTEWELMGKPEVSVMKIDVEGAEIQVLEGAKNCIESTKPYIFLEWNKNNLSAHNCHSDILLTFAEVFDYKIFSVIGCHLPYRLTLQMLKDKYRLPLGFFPVKSPAELKLKMLSSEDFLLVPKSIRE